MPTIKLIVVSTGAVALSAVSAAGFFGPMAGDDAVLLQLPTLAMLILVVAAAWADWIGTWEFALAAVFLALHGVAAYYGYNNVPYDDWLDSLFGWRLATWLESDRNHYDRLIHFLYGLLLFLPVRQTVQRSIHIKPRSASWVAVSVLLSTSLLYEVGEWLVAVFMAPDVADRYNGQQGDMWDAQKDMALAACGATLAAALSLVASYTNSSITAPCSTAVTGRPE